MTTTAGIGTCPACGSGVRVVGDPIEGTMHYESTGPFSEDELDQLASALRIVIGTHGAQVLPETLERMRALRSKVLQIAFMETCRDA